MRILMLGDIHASATNVEALVHEASQGGTSFDAVVVDGDCANVPSADLAAHDAEHRAAPALSEVSMQMQQLQRLTKSARLFYVPGNHDPPQMFGGRGAGDDARDRHDAGGAITCGTNIHERCAELAE